MACSTNGSLDAYSELADALADADLPDDALGDSGDSLATSDTRLDAGTALDAEADAPVDDVGSELDATLDAGAAMETGVAVEAGAALDATPHDTGLDASRFDTGVDAPFDAGSDAPPVDANLDCGMMALRARTDTLVACEAMMPL